MIGAVVGVRAQGSPRPPAPEIAGRAGGPRPAPATEPGFVRVPAPGVLSGHGEHGPLLRVPAPGWGVATIPVFPPYPALRIPAPGESMLHEVYAPNYRQARPRPGEVDSVMSPGIALRKPDRIVCYASSRLLRPFTLHCAPFSRTVKGEGAQQRKKGAADAGEPVGERSG